MIYTPGGVLRQPPGVSKTHFCSIRVIQTSWIIKWIVVSIFPCTLIYQVLKQCKLYAVIYSSGGVSWRPPGVSKTRVCSFRVKQTSWIIKQMVQSIFTYPKTPEDQILIQYKLLSYFYDFLWKYRFSPWPVLQHYYLNNSTSVWNNFKIQHDN